MLAKLLLNRIEKQAKPAVSFNPKRCLRSRLSKNTCDICISHCEKQAITLQGRSIVYNENICSDCMVCVTACPNDAFSCDFDMLTFFKAFHANKSEEPMVLSCQKQSHHANQISIPCIGLFPEAIWAALNCVAPRDFFLDVHQCADCDNGYQLKILHEKVQGLLSKSGPKNGIKIHYITSNGNNTGGIGLQRRSLLRAAKKSFMEFGREVSADCLTGEKTEEIGMEEKEPIMVSRILQITLDMLQDDDNSKKELLFSYLNTVTANENCTLCPLCSGMCPTGALKRKNMDGAKELTFTSAKCSGCGLCLDFCKSQALSLRKGCEDTPQNSYIISH